MEVQLIILGVLIIFSGFFSGAEIALFSLSSAKVRTLLEQDEKNSEMLARIKEEPQKLLITILIANNLVNIGSSSLATVLAIEKFGNAGAGIATGAMTFLILFFGEIVPKSFAQRYAEKWALTIAPAMRAITVLLIPFVWSLNLLTIAVQKLFRIPDTPLVVSEDDVKAMVNIGHEEGSLEDDEKEMIENVFALNDTTARDVMTPNEYMVGFPMSDTIGEVLPIIEKTGYSRFPVFASSDGDVEGILYIKDVFVLLADELEGAATAVLHKKVSELMISPLFVPDTMVLDDLMDMFQERRTHMGVVVDEHGSVVGLITLEDILERLVGEIKDETDIGSEMIERIDSHIVLVDPRVSIGQINAFFGSSLSGPESKNIGWRVLKEFGRIPEKGDSVVIDDYSFIVEEADDRRIKRLKMIKTAKARMQ